MNDVRKDRRKALGLIGAASSSLLLLGCSKAGEPAAGLQKEVKEEEISPAEDLMREHGVLNRVLLIYEETARRLDSRQKLPPGALAGAAGIIHRFIEDYHEKLEEDFLFPRFEKAGRLVDLVQMLRAQHRAGRELTAKIQGLASPEALRKPESSRKLTGALRRFVRMYRPHEAREDTVLFPALRTIVSRHEYDELGEQFEEKEEQLFGMKGFERIVEEVAELEKRLGIYELGQFTPTG